MEKYTASEVYNSMGYRDAQVVLADEAQTEIDITYGKAFVAGHKNGKETMQAKVDELVDMLEELLQEYNDTYSPDELNIMDELIAKHKGECDD